MNQFMCRPKHKRTIALLLALIACVGTALCACQTNPEEPIVSSKKNGIFSEIIHQNSTEKYNSKSSDLLPVTHVETFFSTDKSVKFTFNINQTVTGKDMPVIEVVPHYLTTEDAQRVADILFGNVDFFEADPLLAPQYRKGEIQESIARWSNYTSSDAICKLLGQNDEFMVERVKARIEELTAMYEFAQDDSTRVPCQWKFNKSSVYMYSPQEVESMDTSSDNDAIMATCKVNGIGYNYDVVTRNKADYKLNMISAYFDSSKSPMSIDANIYSAALTRTPPPTEDQIASVKSAAMEMLKQMELGEWMIDQCYVRTLGETILEHVICINAVPVINGIAALRQPQLTDLTSDSTYSSNYYTSDVNFEFSANGDLIKFTMCSPIDVKQIVNENVATIDMDTLLEKAKKHLALSDSQQYGLSDPSGILKENLETSVDISEINYGLLRIKVPNTDDNYYFVPGVVLYGTVETVGADSKQLYYASDAPYAITALNAVDGTVVSLSNG